MSNKLEIAKEITLAILPKLLLPRRSDMRPDEHAEYVAKEIVKVYQIIYNGICDLEKETVLDPDLLR